MKFPRNYHEDTHINGMSSSIIIIIKGYFPYVLSRDSAGKISDA